MCVNTLCGCVLVIGHCEFERINFFAALYEVIDCCDFLQKVKRRIHENVERKEESEVGTKNRSQNRIRRLGV